MNYGHGNDLCQRFLGGVFSPIWTNPKISLTRTYRVLEPTIDFLIAGTAFITAVHTPGPPWIAPGTIVRVLLPLSALTALSRFFESYGLTEQSSAPWKIKKVGIAFELFK